ncbi:MAG: ATPase [Treponema sp.]|nr:ATPase [Treponema sp.]
MIVPMKKVSIIILEKEKLAALTALRKLGLVHLEAVEGASEKLSALKDAHANAFMAASILSEIKVKKHTKSQQLNGEQIAQLCAEVVNLTEERKSLLDRIAADLTELDRFEKWGSVNPDDFAYLKEKGVALAMYEIPSDKYLQIADTVDTILVNTGKRDVRFLLIADEEGRPEGLPPEAFEVPMPVASTAALEAEITDARKHIDKIDAVLLKNAAYVPQIKSFREKVAKEIEFENVYSGMYAEREGKATDLAWISGYIPEDALATLEAAARENNWALASADIEADDNPPTKLKNNKVASLIYPLTDFLGTVPGYREFDISGWFLLFFTIFFGMIFGDGGYGLLVVIAMIVMMIKTKKERKPMHPGFILILLLGISSVTWGILTCSWFGLSADALPDAIKNLSVPPISAAYSDRYDGVHSLLTTDQNLQVLCFSIAFIQLSIAHVKCFIRNRKSLKCLGDIGGLFMLWGMVYVVLMLVISSAVFGIDKIVFGVPIGKVALVLLAVGFVLNFIFSNYDGSIGASILESCKNIISVILGVVNVFSDVLSYIRLWAVALAGGAISSTVNSMAGPLLGHAIFFLFFVILVVFGHGLNIILNVLSVIVHGVRLNTLEFSNHLGMEWSGYKYEPFREAAQN